MVKNIAGSSPPLISRSSPNHQENQQPTTPTQNLLLSNNNNTNNNTSSSFATPQHQEEFRSAFYDFDLPPRSPSKNNNNNDLLNVLNEALREIVHAAEINNIADIFVQWPTQEKSLIGSGSFGKVFKVVPRVVFDQVAKQCEDDNVFSFFCHHSASEMTSTTAFKIEQDHFSTSASSSAPSIVVIKELIKTHVTKLPLSLNHFFGEVAATSPTPNTVDNDDNSSSTPKPKSLNKRVDVPFYTHDDHNNNNNNNIKFNSIFHSSTSVFLVLELCAAPRPTLETRIAHVIARNCPEKISRIDTLMRVIEEKYLLSVLESSNVQQRIRGQHQQNNTSSFEDHASSGSSERHTLASLKEIFSALNPSQKDFLLSNYFDDHQMMTTLVASRSHLNLPPSAFVASMNPSFEIPSTSPCLFDLIVAYKKLPTFNIINTVLSQLSEGLAYLHETMRMIHRDLKTENIVVTTERRAILMRGENNNNQTQKIENASAAPVYGVKFEEKVQAYIVDFGFAKRLDVDTPIFDRYQDSIDPVAEVVGLVNPAKIFSKINVHEQVACCQLRRNEHRILRNCTNNNNRNNTSLHHDPAASSSSSSSSSSTISNQRNNTNTSMMTMNSFSLTPCGTDVYNSYEFLSGVVAAYDDILNNNTSDFSKRRPRWSHVPSLMHFLENNNNYQKQYQDCAEINHTNNFSNSAPSSSSGANCSPRDLLTKMDAWGLGNIAYCCFHGRPAFRLNCLQTAQNNNSKMSDHVRLKILKGIVDHGPRYDDFNLHDYNFFPAASAAAASTLSADCASFNNNNNNNNNNNHNNASSSSATPATDHVLVICGNLMKPDLTERWSARTVFAYLSATIEKTHQNRSNADCPQRSDCSISSGTSSSSSSSSSNNSSASFILTSESRSPDSLKAHERNYLHRLIRTKSSLTFFSQQKIEVEEKSPIDDAIAKTAILMQAEEKCDEAENNHDENPPCFDDHHLKNNSGQIDNGSAPFSVFGEEEDECDERNYDGDDNLVELEDDDFCGREDEDQNIMQN